MFENERQRQHIWRTGIESYSLQPMVDGSATFEWNAKERTIIIRIHQKGSEGDVIYKWQCEGNIHMVRPELADIKKYDPVEDPFGVQPLNADS